MMILLWLKGLFRTTMGRMAATASGIALAVGLLLVLGMFVVAAGHTMTARTIENVPVDWQVELAPGADRAVVEKALADTGFAKVVRVAEYATVDGFSATTAGTQQVTGAGKVLGLPGDYLATFPRQVELLSGSADGPLLFTQTAANLHVGVGDTISVERPGVGPVPLTVSGVVAIPNIDSMFQAVGMPSGMAPQSPPDNVVILPEAAWHAAFDGQRAVRPDSTRTQLHARLDRSLLPADPVGAFTTVREMANNLEARLVGSAAVANNLAARLDGVRADALYAKVLFLFLGAPGVVLAILITLAIAGVGAPRRRFEQSLLRIRGASPVQAQSRALVETAMVGLAGSAVGVLIGVTALPLLGVGVHALGIGWWIAAAVVLGFGVALGGILLPAIRASSRVTVAGARSDVERAGPSLWERLGLDLALLVIAGVVFWQARGTGYQIVLAAEGVAQTSVSYAAFLAPLALWAGLGLLAVRLSRLGLHRAPALVRRILAPVAGDLSATVGASLTRQRSRLSHGVGLLALAVAFAVSTAIFNMTYDAQSRVDAELTNGADVNVTGTTADPAGAMLKRIRDSAGVIAAEPMIHRYAYVGNDLQDIYGVDPAAIENATTLADAYFADGSASATMAALGRTPDGVLVSEETVKDFQLQKGDTVNLRLQLAGDHQYHSVPFVFVGVAREFPTAPKDSFLVANASYLAKVTGADAREVVLVRAADPAGAADGLRALVGSDPALKITALGEVQSLISSSLTAVNLGALARLELAYGLLLIVAASGLVLGLGFAERRRTFAILGVLGARPGQIRAFLSGETILTTVGGLVFGLATGFGVASMLVVMLSGVFDPPPETIRVPLVYLLAVTAGSVAVAAAVVLLFERLHRRPDIMTLRAD